MFALKRLLQTGRKKIVWCRSFTVLYEEELMVAPFCNVNVKIPFNISIVPLDVYRYQNCDKLIIKLLSDQPEAEKSVIKLKCTYDNGTVDISSENGFLPVTCNIEAPIKANINITTLRGNINLSGFNGEHVRLETTTGNIIASKCHCSNISIKTSSGNINCNNVMQAAEIHLQTGKAGSIRTGRLQGTILKVETENGNVATESSYCNSSSFITKNGNLDLHSTHKDCKVLIKEKGFLRMIGFDGTLHTILNEGDADIQLARIQGNSEIKITGTGSLTLKLFELCLQDTSFKLIYNSLQISEDVRLNASNEAISNVLIDCPKSNVVIQSASWMEMFNIKLPM